jgi:hypothetical protein
MSGLFGGGSQKISTSAPLVASMRLQTSVSGRAIPVVFGRTRVAGNLLQYVDFTATPHTSVTSSGGGGGKGGGGGATQENTTYTYSAGIVMSLCAGEISSVPRVWKGKSLFSLAQLGLSLYVGDFAQTAYPYMATNHPGVARTYRGLAYVASGSYQLDDNAALENHNFEVQGPLAYGGGIDDCNVPDVLEYILTDGAQGLGLSGDVLDDWGQWSDYCVANGIFISPAYIEREPVAQVIARLAAIGNAGLVSSEEKLKVVPYGDTEVLGNGVTFTPDLTPLYDFTDDDYLDKEQPVRLTRKTPADRFNLVVVKIFNRDNDYNEEPKEGKDQADIEINGVKPDDNERVYHEIVRTDTGQTVADQELRRTLYGACNVYTTRVPDCYDLLEPMDLVTLTDEGMGLDRQLVRVVKIDESDDGGLDLECEEMLVGSAAPAAYASQSSAGYAADYNTAPGDVNDPVMFIAPYTLALGGLELWIGISGGPEFGGCEVWVSDDDASYQRVGTFRGKSRTGVTSTAMAVQADPDNVTELDVNLFESAGTILAGTQLDANRLNTLCYAGGELFSYRDAALIGENQYELSHLRRGAHGSTVSNVAAGSAFVRVDPALFKYPFPPEYSGRTVYLKFLAFNTVGGAKQTLDEVDAYPYTLSQAYAGAPRPPGVFGLELFGQGNDTEFVGRDAKFAWRASGNQHAYEYGSEPFGAGSGIVDPYFKDFEIQISDADGNVRRNDHTVETVYTYTYEKNAEDGGGVPVREFTITVWQRNEFGRVSVTPAVLTVNNPQPALPGGVDIRAAFKTVFVGYTPPTETDWAGILVWMSETPGFTPGDINLVYQGADSLAVIDATSGVQYYLRYASYDTFGTAGVTVSGEVTVTTSKIAPVDIGIAAVLTTHIADEAVTTVKIALESITEDLISAGAITATGIADGAVTTAKIALDAITNDLIAANAVTATEIADGSISTPKLVAGSVTTGKLAAGSVTTNELAAGAVTAAKITAATITATEIATDAITAAKILAGAVTTAKLAAGSVTTNELAAGAVTAVKITAGTITANEIASGAISTAKLQAGAVTANEIAANTITTGKMAANSITASEIATDAVVAAKIQAGAVTTNKLAAGAVTANEIAANTITAAKMVAGTITSASAILATAAVETLTVAGNAITAPASAYSNAGVGALAGVDTNALSVTVTTTGQPIFICGFFTAVYGGGGTASVALKLKRGSTTLATTTIQSLLSGAQGEGTGMGFSDQPAAGTYTYYLVGNPSADSTLYECSLYQVETKR